MSTAPARVRSPGAPALPPSGILLLIGLTLFWGLNWPIMKIALLELPPFTFRSFCLFGGGALLIALTLSTGRKVAFAPRLLPSLALISVFNITGWHLFSAYGLLNTGSGRAAVIGYTMPLWASILSAPVLQVRVGAREIVALTAGMVALALLIASDLGALEASPRGALLMTGAAVSWAIGTVMVKRLAPWPMPVTALTGWQQLLGGLPVLLGWWLLEPVPDLSVLSLPALVSLAYAILVAMVFCHTAYFRLVELLPAHIAAIATLATPAVGVVSGAILLDEEVGLPEVAALALVVAGLGLLVRPSAR